MSAHTPGPGMNKDGGQAFPSGEGMEYEAGMSLRDWFAGQALAGLCVEMRTDSEAYRAKIAVRAYELADAMLAARGK